MKKLIYTKDMQTEEWLNNRRLGIGGSDASTILGLNPFNSILRLWEDKTGRIPVEEKENEYTHFGHVMEPVIRKEFERRTGHKVRRSNFILQSEEYSYLLADVDGFTKDEDGTPCIFEAKTASEYKKKVWEQGVPEEYVAQVQHYMLVTGFTKAYVAAIAGGNSFYCHVVERDEEFQKVLLEKETAFWACVLDRIPPKPDGAEATKDYLQEKYSKAVLSTVELPQDAEILAGQYKLIGEEMQRLQKEKTALSNQLKDLMKENETGYAGRYTVTWKNVQKKSLDTEKVKKELGGDYEQYLVDSSYRKFSVA